MDICFEDSGLDSITI